MPGKTDNSKRLAVNRRKVLGAIGAGAVGATALGASSASAVAAASEEPTDSHLSGTQLEGADMTRITGRGLVTLARSTFPKEDVQNALPASYGSNMSLGDLVSKGKIAAFEPTGGSNTPETVMAAAATYEMEEGNTLTSVSFVFDEKYVIAYYEYDEAVEDTVTEAQLWDISNPDNIEESELTLVDTSANTEPASGEVSALATCTCWKHGKKKKKVCTKRNLSCEAAACGGCALTGGPAKFIACVAVLCPLAQRGCCRKYKKKCYPCALI